MVFSSAASTPRALARSRRFRSKVRRDTLSAVFFFSSQAPFNLMPNKLERSTKWACWNAATRRIKSSMVCARALSTSTSPAALTSS